MGTNDANDRRVMLRYLREIILLLVSALPAERLSARYFPGTRLPFICMLIGFYLIFYLIWRGISKLWHARRGDAEAEAGTAPAEPGASPSDADAEAGASFEPDAASEPDAEPDEEPEPDAEPEPADGGDGDETDR